MPILNRLYSRSGQTLMIAIGIVSLLLIAGAAMVMVNQRLSEHQNANEEITKGRGDAEVGLAYAMDQLSRSEAIWNAALLGDFSSTDCNTGNIVKGPSGKRFKLACSADLRAVDKLQPFQVAVTVTPIKGRNASEAVSGQSLKFFISRRTLGASLASGDQAAAAVMMVRTPVPGNGTLSVHWGPVVCLGIEPSSGARPVWNLTGEMDTQRYPRKYYSGAIAGSLSRSAAATSDLKEYWSYASLQPGPLIDEEAYKALAKADPTPDPTSLRGWAINRVCGGGPPDCSFFRPAPGDTYIFEDYFIGNGTDILNRVYVSTHVLYVDGNADFRGTRLYGSAIVTGSLILSRAAPLRFMESSTYHVPANAALEYRHNPTAQPCPRDDGALADVRVAIVPDSGCMSDITYPTGGIQLSGFLYVKGNLYVQTPDWILNGVLMVGDREAPPGTSGRIVLNSGSLDVFYDDWINRIIKVRPVSGTTISLQTDPIQEKRRVIYGGRHRAVSF